MASTQASLRNIESEYENISKLRGGWIQKYMSIIQCTQFEQYTSVNAKNPSNKAFNRYRDVLPYDHTRVILDDNDNDYINANYVTVESAQRSYILTQGPLPTTVSHFWKMIWQENCKSIIMLNRFVEKKEVKCCLYWPSDGDNRLSFDDNDLVVSLKFEQDHGDFTTRTFSLLNDTTQESRDVHHFHYNTWPDFGVPSSPDAFLGFLCNVREAGALEPGAGPAVVHCSAGIGRSGTFCLVDSVLRMIENGENDINIIDILCEMRKYRMGLVQTAAQLRFAYETIIEGAKRLDPTYVSEASTEDIYSRVPEEHGQDGEPPVPLHRYNLDQDDDDDPPVPPPRITSQDGFLNRRLPSIPNSVSFSDFDPSGDNSPFNKTIDLPSESSSEEELSSDECPSLPDSAALRRLPINYNQWKIAIKKQSTEEKKLDEPSPEIFEQQSKRLSQTEAGPSTQELQSNVDTTPPGTSYSSPEPLRKRSKCDDASQSNDDVKEKKKQPPNKNKKKYKPFVFAVGVVIVGVALYAILKM